MSEAVTLPCSFNPASPIMDNDLVEEKVMTDHSDSENTINCDTSQISQDLEEPTSIVDNISIDPLKLRSKISSNEVDWKTMD
jgi:hypothetical protein